jgi:hypothetical protein
MIKTNFRMCLAIIFLSLIGQSALASMNESQGICIPCSADNSSTNFGPAITNEILQRYSNSTEQMNAQNAQSLSRPNRPDMPWGDNNGLLRRGLVFYTKAENPGGGRIRYIFEFWDDNEPHTSTTVFVEPGTVVRETNVWRHCGIGLVRVRAEDKNGLSSDWSDIKKVTIWTIPWNPDRVKGRNVVYVNTPSNYETTSTDICGNLIKYTFYWGDGSSYTTLGYYKSGVWVNVPHQWSMPGVYRVTAVATNTQGKQSGSSYDMTVTVKPRKSLLQDWPLLDASGYSYATMS